MNWTTKKEHHAHMAERQKQNLENSAKNANENWLAERLSATGYKWTRQARWGFRLFDFWNTQLGIDIEIDGPEHNSAKDAKRDTEEWNRSGIMVIRVRNGNEADATEAIEKISTAGSWNSRRALLAKKSIKGGDIAP